MSAKTPNDSSHPDSDFRAKAVDRLLKEPITLEQLADELGVSVGEVASWKEEYLRQLQTAGHGKKVNLAALGKRQPVESAEEVTEKKVIPQPRGKKPITVGAPPADHFHPEERSPLAKKTPPGPIPPAGPRKMKLGQRNPDEKPKEAVPKERPGGKPPIAHAIPNATQTHFDRNWQRAGEGPPPPVVTATLSERLFTAMGSLPVISWLLHGGRFDRAPWVALGLVIMAIAAGVVLYFGRNEPSVPQSAGGEDLMNIRLTRAEVAAFEEALENFYAQSDPQALVPLIRRPDIIEPLLTAHYEDEPLTPATVDSFDNFRRDRVAGLVLQAVDVRLDTAIGIRTVYAEAQDEGLKIDWESAVNYQSMGWGECQRVKPPITTFFRANVQRAAYSEGSFNNPRLWRSYLISHPLESHTFHGFARIDSEAEYLIEEKLGAASVMDQFIVGIRYPDPQPGEEADGMLVEITEVISDTWVVDYPEGEPHFDLRSQ